MTSACGLGLLASVLLAHPVAAADPPYGGTVYAVPNQLTEQDPSRFAGMIDLGRSKMFAYDHRTKGERLAEFFGFEASFNDDTSTVLYVNAEYKNPIDAAEVAVWIARLHGQMPRLCRTGVEDFIIHKTGNDWSASPQHIVIHMGIWEDDRDLGTLEESMLHECAHAVIDPMFEDQPEWKAAQDADGTFISDYARDNPETEDIAETVTLYHGLAFHPFRFPETDRRIIEETIPHRLAFLQKYLTTFDLRP